MTTAILDHTQDLTGADQHRLTQLYPPPDFVKQANHSQLYGNPDELPTHVYAYTAQRAYPCHTKAATWMSALFFADKRGSLPTQQADGLRDRILKSAAYWNIQPDVLQLWEKMAADATAGLSVEPDDTFALVWVAEGRKERHYPLRNAAEVKMASDWFGQYHDKFSFSDKHTIATKILKKAGQYGAVTENTELLDRCAGFGYCAASEAADAWEKRSALLSRSNTHYATEARRMAETVRGATFEARDQGRRIKMAALMDQFDHETGLDKLYDENGLERPEDVLFQITEKVASEFLTQNVQTTTGAVYEKLALEKLDIDTLRQWMGEDLADELGGVMLDTEKLAEILPTLPRPEAEMFDHMAIAAGIPVTAREKAAATGIPREGLIDLAADYQG